MQLKVHRFISFFLLLALSLAAPALAQETTLPPTNASPDAYPYPNGGVANVEGNAGEWDLSTDFFANMYRAGRTDKDVLSNLYLRYDCATSTLYLLVLAEPGAQIESYHTTTENWVKLGGAMKVNNLSGDNGVAPDFHYVGSNGTYATGWEASFVVPPGTYSNLNVHAQVNDGTGSQTSAVANRSISLTLDCTCLGSIGDYVWWDDDRDGDEDYGVEQPLANIRVRLLIKQPDGSYLLHPQIATTNANGYYLFNNLPAGDYLVDVNESDLPPNYTLTTANEPYPWTLSQGEHHRQADFGYDPDPGTVALGDWVWFDVNANGLQDDGNGNTVGVRCITIWLKNSNGVVIGQKNTDSWGNYLYANLPVGNYSTQIDVTDEDLNQIEVGPKCHLVPQYVNLAGIGVRPPQTRAVFFTTSTTKSTSLPTPGMLDLTLDYGISTSPLSVNISSFTAQGSADRITVAWETVTEVDAVAFNLYRSDSVTGALTLLATLPAQTPGGVMGAAYTYEDTAVQTGQTYWYTLEAVTYNGAPTLYGPVSATVQAPSAVTLSGVAAGSQGTGSSAGLLLAALLAAAVLLAVARSARKHTI